MKHKVPLLCAESVLGLLAAAAMLGQARAADLPSHKTAPLIPPVLDAWSGPYVGIGAGAVLPTQTAWTAEAYQTGITQTGLKTFTPYAWGASATFNTSEAGFLGAIIAGWNFRWTPNSNIIFGVENEFAIPVGAHSTVTYAVPGPLFGLGVTPQVAQIGRAWEWGDTLGPRLGYLILPNMLLYGNGGVAFVQAPESIRFGSAAVLANGTGGSNGMRVGWFAGAGVDWQFSPGWRVGVSYKYVGLPSVTAQAAGLSYGSAFQAAQIAAGTSFIASGNPSAHIVELRLTRSLDFWAPSSVVTAY